MCCDLFLEFFRSVVCTYSNCIIARNIALRVLVHRNKANILANNTLPEVIASLASEKLFQVVHEVVEITDFTFLIKATRISA
jgi:hypothetical protein